jgi:hypothetical protein
MRSTTITRHSLFQEVAAARFAGADPMAPMGAPALLVQDTYVTGGCRCGGCLQKNRRQRRRLVTNLLRAIGHFIAGVAVSISVDLQSILAVA